MARSVVALSAALLLGAPASLHAQKGRQAASACSLGSVTSVEPLKSGVRLRAGDAIEEITALRDDVLRVRIAPHRALPEDASWAVLPEARHASVAVTPESAASTVGFRTGVLHVSLSRADLKLTVTDNSGRVMQQDAAPVCFEGTSFRIAGVMPEDEHYFGLGDKTGPFDRRGHAFDLWNTDSYRFQESTDPLYKAIPFFLSFRAGMAAGVLLDNTWRSSFDFGKDKPDVYTFGATDGPLDYYILAGPTPRQVVESYGWLTGKPPLPPRWMLGFQQSRYTYTPESRLMAVADRLRADKIPADALYLDIGFQQKNRPFTVDTTAFPDFPATVAKLKAMDFHLVVITDLHIAKLSGQGYVPYDSGTVGNHFVHNPDGSVFSGIVWPGESVFPDYTQASTRDWWGGLYTEFTKGGVEGFWNDMNEPSVFNTPNKTMPLNVVHRIEGDGFTPRNASHAEIHNVYGMENSRATFEGLRKLLPEERPFVLTRATYAGGQRYATTWTGDDSSTWNHLRMTAPMLKNLGLSGFSYSGADVGGFAGSPPADLLTRWLQIAAFHPIDRDHTELGTADQEPWGDGPAQEGIRRKYIEERYRLMPYLYTLMDETTRSGMPMMRPLFLDYPQGATDGHPIDVDPGTEGEFLLGHDLLIAPSPYPEEPDAYGVEFPSPDWYDYWTGERIPAKKKPVPPANNVVTPPSGADLVPLTTSVHPELAILPVYVRGGAILPISPLVQSTNETPKGPLTLRIYAGPDCRGSLYLDDGHSYRYQGGEALRMTFGCEIKEGVLHLHASSEGTYKPWWKEVNVAVYGWNPVHNGNVTLTGAAGARSSTAIAGGALTFTIANNGEAFDLDIK